jgi:F-type H+-transporting ATPase subunit b
MPQLDPSSFASQLFWLLISFCCLYFAMSRVALPAISRILQTRSDKLDNDLKAAEQAKIKAENVEFQYNSLLKKTKEKSAKLIAETEAKVKMSSEQQIHELDQELHEKAKLATINLQKAKNQLTIELQQIELELVKLIVARLTNNKLNYKSPSANIKH